ncbi:MAG TPA: methionyl-tRNA formyltransferase [Candidatus Paceibacterota bacterium]|nr:methionyl-tRNA formyltransferase [Candidatus Paceibacterota bacterium]
MTNIKFAFFGTPEVASQTLDILLANNLLPSLIITSPDKRAGRDLKLTPSPVSIWAKNHNIKCLKPEKLDDIFLDELFHLTDQEKIDIYVVVAYGKILPDILIKYPAKKTINVHYSLLPKYRGASPLESAIQNGENETGVTIQEIEYKLDSGPILATQKVPIDTTTTKIKLKEELIEGGANLLIKTLNQIKDGTINKIAQDEDQATFCKKIKKEDGLIDPQGNDLENWNKYRAFYGWPGIYFFADKKDKNIRLKITQASLLDGKFIIEKVIPENKKEISYSDFLRQK